MQATEENRYVANAENDLLWKNREERKRSSTDMPFLIVLGLLSVLWIGIGIYGFSTGEVPDFFHDKQFGFEAWIRKNEIREALYDNRYTCFGFAWLSILLIALYFIMVRWLTKLTIYITMILALPCILAATYSLIVRMGVIAFMPVLIITYIGYGSMIYALGKVGMKTMCKLVGDSCKAMICFPSSLIIVMLEVGLEFAVLVYTAAAIVYLLFIKKVEIAEWKIENVPPYVFVLLPVFICISLWINCFIAAFRRMLLHGIFAHWYKASDKKSISNTVGLRCFSTAFRFHMGTIAFASTIFTIIPIIRALFNSGKDLFKQSRKRPVILMYSLWTAFLNATANASVTCVVYGNNFYRSTKDALELVMRNPLKYIAARMVTYWMIMFGCALIPTLTVCMAVLSMVANGSSTISELPPSYVYVPVIIISTISSLMTAMLIVIFDAAVESVILCFFEELSSAKTFTEDEEYLIEDQTV